MKGTHKSVILNVTNNGKQLLRKDSSSSSLSSGDVLDRVVVYHEMENMGGVAVWRIECYMLLNYNVFKISNQF